MSRPYHKQNIILENQYNSVNYNTIGNNWLLNSMQTELVQNFQNFNFRLSSLEKNNTELNKENDKLNKKTDELKKENDVIKKENDVIKKENDELKNKIADIYVELENQNKKLDYLMRKEKSITVRELIGHFFRILRKIYDIDEGLNDYNMIQKFFYFCCFHHVF